MNQRFLAYSGLSIVLIVVCVIFINVIGSFLPWRADITKDQLYTVSEGTQKILADLEEPVTIKFYFSQNHQELTPRIKSYAQRVQELLEEYAYLSNDKIHLQVFDSKPDTEVEEWAQKYGISQIVLPSGEPFYFGMVASLLDQEMAIPYFDERRQKFLEYDISQAIFKVSNPDTPKIGLVSALNLMGGPYPGQQNEPVFLSELRKNFEVEHLSQQTEEIAEDIDLLLAIYPEGLEDKTRYAIDQYVLRGGRLIVAVDPSSREAGRDPRMGRFGHIPDPKKGLGTLLENWGIEYDSSKVVGDFAHAVPVNTGNGKTTRFPLWMQMTEESLDKTHPITSFLESLLLVDAGSLAKVEGSEVDFTPLLQTSPQSGFLDSSMVRFSQPEEVVRKLEVDNHPKTLAALVQGKFTTAFPEGRPQEEATKKSSEEKKEEKPLKHAHLSEAKEPNTILVIADSDFLFDDFAIQKFSLLGQTITQPTNDNLNLILNAIETLSGNDALLSIRSRGQFSRPFTRVVAMQQEAQLRFQSEERALQKKLDEVQEKLRALESKKDPKQKQILTAEQQTEIQKFRDEELNTRKRLREVRKMLREDIEALGDRLLAMNMLGIPAFVSIAGVIFYTSRTRRRRRD